MIPKLVIIFYPSFSEGNATQICSEPHLIVIHNLPDLADPRAAPWVRHQAASTAIFQGQANRIGTSKEDNGEQQKGQWHGQEVLHLLKRFGVFDYFDVL